MFGKRKKQDRATIGMIQVMEFMKQHQLKQKVFVFDWASLYKICKTMPSIIVYTGVEPWKEMYYAVLFDGKQTTGLFTTAFSLDDIRKSIPTEHMVCAKRTQTDLETIVETWM